MLRDVSLTLQHGEFGCLLGPSGCGKTTLLRAIAGFQPLTAGVIELRGETVSTPHTRRSPARRRIGMVHQHLALFPHLTVAANVGFGLHDLSRTARAERIAETLMRCNLAGLQDRYPHQLSGGQRQRVALARALAPQPDLLLLDEPFSSLDSHLRRDLREELRALLSRLNLAALLVTHDQDEAFAFAERVGIVRDDGALEQWAPPHEIRKRPASAFVVRFVDEARPAA